MKKIFVLLLASLIMVLTISLMFTSVVSAEDSVEIAGKCYCLVEGDLLFEKVSIKPNLTLSHFKFTAENAEFAEKIYKFWI